MFSTDAPDPDPADPPVPAWPGEVRMAGGFELFVRSAGDPGGEPAVFVHGLGGSSTNWTDLMALLGDRFACLAPDLPGHGRSPRSPSGRYPLRLHAAAVEALLAAGGRGPVHLFGNSLGGAVATLVAARRPDLVRSLTLISPAFPQLDPRRTSDPCIALVLVPGATRLLARSMSRISIEERTRGVLELCYADPSRIHPQRLAEEVAAASERSAQSWAQTALLSSTRGLISSYLRPGRWSLWSAARRVTAPVLVIWGEQDRLVPVSLASRVARAFGSAPGGARLEIFADTGHVAQMEWPDRTAAAVLAALGGDRSGAATASRVHD